MPIRIKFKREPFSTGQIYIWEKSHGVMKSAN